MKVLTFDRLSAEKGIPWNRDHLRRKIQNREFPAPIQMSIRRIAWVEQDIDDWLAEKAAAAKLRAEQRPPAPVKRPIGRPRKYPRPDEQPSPLAASASE
jgi:hypothetical protein